MFAESVGRWQKAPGWSSVSAVHTLDGGEEHNYGEEEKLLVMKQPATLHFTVVKITVVSPGPWLSKACWVMGSLEAGDG